MKKIISVLLSVTMLIFFASCQNNEETGIESETTSQQNTETATRTILTDTETSTESVSETITETELSSVKSASQPNTETTVVENDPSEWSDEKIIEFYKTAAVKSQSRIKSVKKMTLKELTVNDGDGALGGLIDFCMPFFIAALEKNSTEFDGITGGYENLGVSDTTSVKAYKDGDYTVIEMKMKEQTDGAHGEEKSGTVGHAISVVGDLAVVQAEFPKLDIRFDDADISLKYSNPKLKVKINKDGIIESGEWSYTVCINIENLRIDVKNSPIGATVKKGYGEVDFICTVG